MDEVLPRLRVPLAEGRGNLDLHNLFGRRFKEIWLEVGFGGGEHLAAQAAAHPDVGFIGCEPYINGVAALLVRLEKYGLRNIRIHDDDARTLIEDLPDSCISRVFVLFPDPWPKLRQQKRRFIGPEVLDRLARIMALGAELRMATDDSSYLPWILEHSCRHDSFEWLAEGPRDWRQRPADWPETRYEAKAKAAGRNCTYLRFCHVK